jgi:hypothetical protein
LGKLCHVVGTEAYNGIESKGLASDKKGGKTGTCSISGSVFRIKACGFCPNFRQSGVLKPFFPAITSLPDSNDSPLENRRSFD